MMKQRPCLQCGLPMWPNRKCPSYLCKQERRIKAFYDFLVPNGDCLEWRGYCTEKGYGRTSFLGLLVLVHRLHWFIIFGEWPKGELDHLCENKACVKVSHLQDLSARKHALVSWERR